jgi:addiction module HigA family antidote
MTMKNPCHPGEIIREEVIKPLGLTVTDAAKALAVARPTLSNLLNENASLTAEMALPSRRYLVKDGSSDADAARL